MATHVELRRHTHNKLPRANISYKLKTKYRCVPCRPLR